MRVPAEFTRSFLIAQILPGFSVIPVPESIEALAAYQLRYESTKYYSWVCSGPICFGIGALSEPATESHVVNRGTPVAPCWLKTQRERSPAWKAPASQFSQIS
jgi:hypothetical protein